MSLSEEDLWYFNHTGYYLVPELLPGDLVERLNAVTDEQISGMIEPVVWEKSGTREPNDIRRLSKILSRDRAYLEAAVHPVVLNPLTSILGPNVELLMNKHNHIMVRPPGSEHVYWHSGEEPYHPTLITALVYLEESTLENGCIRIVPGSPRRPFQRVRRPGGAFEESDLFYKSLPVPMPRGGVLLFNDCCFHGAGVNGAGTSRRSMTLAYQAHDPHDVMKDDPEKILAAGERIYIGHPHPFPQPD